MGDVVNLAEARARRSRRQWGTLLLLLGAVAVLLFTHRTVRIEP